ncbi:MAG: CBS domain-containing protein [Burkholderiales bacterium]
MFSVYGKAGRVFRGSMEELRQLGPVVRVSRAQVNNAIGRDPQDQNPSQLPELGAPVQGDGSRRSALQAYAQSTKADTPRHPLTQVSALMSRNVITVADHQTVEQAWHILSDKHIGQAPVVTAEGMLVGLLSRADLMRPQRMPGPESHALVWRALLMQKVADVMWTPVPCVAPDADIRRVARVLLDSGLPGLPVVQDDGQVVGFVSRTDILRAVVSDPALDLWI